MEFTSETSVDGVVERDFALGEIAGVLWSPAAGEPTPLILLGHGGGQHKRAPGNVGRARRFVTCGFAVAAIDAPGHGDRVRTTADEEHVARLRAAQSAGEPIYSIVLDYNATVAERAVPEWQSTLDALLTVPGIVGPVGYCGLMMGTAIGIHLTAVESRVTAAVLGGLGEETLAEPARKITVPIEFALQWDDEHVDRQSGLALFDAFASTEKTLHANAGGHLALPRFEADSAARFFERHLKGAAATRQR